MEWDITSEVQIKNHKKYIKCVCSCGMVRYVYDQLLKKGKSTSCGCKKGLLIAKAKTIHGHCLESKVSSEYKTWAGMWYRCTNKKSNQYPNYGGRGITVCQEWEKFENFLNDMGPKPSPSHTIDRRNNDDGYHKENCYWATKEQQANNTRTNDNITFNGQTLSLTKWAREIGISRGTLYNRLRVHNWNVKDALTIKPRSKSQ